MFNFISFFVVHSIHSVLMKGVIVLSVSKCFSINLVWMLAWWVVATAESLSILYGYGLWNSVLCCCAALYWILPVTGAEWFSYEALLNFWMRLDIWCIYIWFNISSLWSLRFLVCSLMSRLGFPVMSCLLSWWWTAKTHLTGLTLLLIPQNEGCKDFPWRSFPIYVYSRTMLIQAFVICNHIYYCLNENVESIICE